MVVAVPLVTVVSVLRVVSVAARLVVRVVVALAAFMPWAATMTAAPAVRHATCSEERVV